MRGSMLSTKMIWDRREGADEISENTYNLTIGAVLLWGFALNHMMIQAVPYELVASIHPIVFMIGYIACAFAGTAVYTKSDDPMISFLGYNMIVVPLGLVLVLVLPGYSSDVVSRALFATGSVTGIMMMVGGAYPKAFLSIGRTLGVAFICTFVVEMGFVLFTGSSPAIFDWVMVAIFSLYIGYDWARAQALPKTLDNAVDAAASLYVDIIILFMRLLRIFARR
jgi:FtsH-binding integral membrane protein